MKLLSFQISIPSPACTYVVDKSLIAEGGQRYRRYKYVFFCWERDLAIRLVNWQIIASCRTARSNSLLKFLSSWRTKGQNP